MPRVASPVFACFPSLSLSFCLHLAPGLRERLKRAASSLKITSRGILRRYPRNVSRAASRRSLDAVSINPFRDTRTHKCAPCCASFRSGSIARVHFHLRHNRIFFHNSFPSEKIVRRHITTVSVSLIIKDRRVSSRFFRTFWVMYSLKMNLWECHWLKQRHTKFHWRSLIFSQNTHICLYSV